MLQQMYDFLVNGSRPFTGRYEFQCSGINHNNTPTLPIGEGLATATTVTSSTSTTSSCIDTTTAVTLPHFHQQAKARSSKSRSRSDNSNISSMKFIMSRDVETVKEAYDEWVRGINGNPSVTAMDEKYKGAWKNRPADNKWYYRRKPLIEEIQWAMSQGVAEEDVIRCAQDMLDNLVDGGKLSKFCVSIKAAHTKGLHLFESVVSGALEGNAP
ncbi:hypothetical protein TRVA0_001S00386 [Trichomonascus vanleenenianus]|uniref:transcription activator GCR1-like domain-containing protein n=1 Tax=Trichomonascus vanleenenianus TaxID=2268995 RepID=UPI003ECA37DB